MILLKENILTSGERKGAGVIYNKQHRECRMLPVVIDCRSIHSSSVKTSQPDAAAFFFFFLSWYSCKMAFCPSHQQLVFIYKRIVPHAALHCLPSCSPVTHVPRIIQSVTPLPVSCTIVGRIHRHRGPQTGCGMVAF